MDTPRAPELKSALLARVREAGYPLTERGLKRCHPLLPGSGQRHLKGKRGSETLYPPGTGDQLLVICALRRKHKIRRLKDIGWCLWWCGFQVHKKYSRPRLLKRAEWYDREGPKIAKLIFPRGNDEISDGAFALFKKLRSPQTRIKSALFRQLRKRTRAGHWETFLRFMFEIQTGQFKGWDHSTNPNDADLKLDKAILDRGLGLDRARIDRPGDNRPWLEGDIDEPLVRLSKTISKHRLVAVLAHTSGAELIRARNELVGILWRIVNASARHEATHGKHAFGLRVAAEIARRPEYDVHSLMLLWWLVFIKVPGIQEQIRRFFPPDMGDRREHEVPSAQLPR